MGFKISERNLIKKFMKGYDRQTTTGLQVILNNLEKTVEAREAMQLDTDSCDIRIKAVKQLLTERLLTGALR